MPLRKQRLGTTILQMMHQLSNRIRRVRRTHNAARPMHTPRDSRCIDAVLRKQRQDIILLPSPSRPQPLTERNRRVSQVGESVVPARVRVLVDYCSGC
jgi:hypothetical protein